jgi:hypothetical protein
MKKSIGFLIYNILILFIPYTTAASSGNISSTEYLDPETSSMIYRFGALREEVIEWKYRTYDNPFLVTGYCWSLSGDPTISQGKTSDTGTLRALGDGTFTFSFHNIDTVGGYISITIRIKTSIPGYNIILIISIIGIVIFIKKKKIKKI